MADKVVLIIDDDRDIRESLREILQDEGYQVLSAANGKEALETLSSGENSRPALILVDLMMPVMSGMEFIAEKKKMPAISEIPTVVMSASHLSSQSISDLRVEGHILKPFDFENLLSTINRYY